jgi:hypothetical protein
MKKILGLLAMALVAAATSTLGACGDSEGDACTTDNDCGSQLLCQPIAGRGDKCCPTPAEESDNESCHAITTPTASTDAGS